MSHVGLKLCRLCIIAGDISPIDVITHVPVLCEEADIPYIYVPSKEVNTRYGAAFSFRFPAVLCTTTVVVATRNSSIAMLQDLGGAGATKRPTSCMLVLPPPLKGEVAEEEKEKFGKEYEEVVKEVKVLLSAVFS